MTNFNKKTMKESDKKQMKDCYLAEIKTNALDAKPSTANGFLRGYEKAFSLHVVSQRSELLLAYEDYLNEYHTKEDRIKQVDKYLKANNYTRCSSDVVCGCYRPNIDNTTQPPKKK